jgi:predicted nucleotidyltransferase
MKKLDALVSKAKKDGDVLAAIVFGSYARGEKHRDIDVCIVLCKRLENGLMSRKRLDYVSETGLDVHIFQQLPLYIKSRVLKEGKVILCSDLNALYDIAIQTAKEFEQFRPFYSSYLEAVKHG